MYNNIYKEIVDGGCCGCGCDGDCDNCGRCGRGN